MEERLIWLLEQNLEKIKNKTILVIGLGGVGGYVVEALTRSGINKIIIVDFDTIDISNLNRQIVTNTSNIGFYKTEAFYQRIKSINKECEVIKINEFINKDNLNLLFSEKIDYLIDCCDSVETKKEIILYCLNNKIKFISSMGMANRIDSSKIKVSLLSKTFNDPLARKLRTMIKINKKIPVVFSEEVPKKNIKLGSIAHVVGTAGFCLTNYVINDILKGDS